MMTKNHIFNWQNLLIFILATYLCLPSEVISSDNLNSSSKHLISTNLNNIITSPAHLTQPGHSKSNSIKIRLNNHHFDPLRKIPSDHISNKISQLKKQKTGDSNRPEYYIVQFDAPIQNLWKKDLKDAGAKILDYVPDFAFIIRLAPDSEQKVRALPHVRWLGEYQPSFKLSRKLADPAYANSNKDKRVSLQLSLFPDEDNDAIKAGISGLDGIIENETTTKWKAKLKISISANKLNELSALTGIRIIEPEPKWKLHNNIAADIMTVRTPRDTYGLYGLGQTVAVCDTGLDQGLTNAANLNDDFEDGDNASRVIQIFDVAGDSDTSDENSGHGTHVSGSVLGNGINSGSNPLTESFPDTSFSGIAPKANLILQAAENNSNGALYLPIDLNILFDEADVAGADLHTNSWGADAGSAYTSNSEEVDQYIWDHKDFLILFSAGNEGIDSDSDGVVDLYSIGAPATAKNCLTIGATENLRSYGGYTFPWGMAWPSDYPAEPISSDFMSDNANGMAAFSSRGPTLDGRYKPDLVAPGTNIVSVRSSMTTGSGWGIYDNDYLYMGGTSMSTPLAAGTAALLREYLITVKGFSSPPAALLKASLINSADNISPGQYGTGVFQEIPPPVPNNIAGWGRINFTNSVYPEGAFGINYYDEQNGLSTDDFHEYTVEVYDSSRPLKINLVWTDYPGSSSVQGGLVNDLDLKVTTPSSEVLYPDNAMLPSIAADLSYYDMYPEYYTSDDVAVKLTPPAYPSEITDVKIGTYSTAKPNPSSVDIDIEIFDDNGAGGMPGTLIYSATVSGLSHYSLTTVLIDGPTITDGSFFVAVRPLSKKDNIIQDGADYGISYYDNGTAWVADTGFTSYIGATVSQPGSSAPDFDRTNNVVGLTLDNPESGTYTIRINGYNVPQSPQPYALVVSGEIESIDIDSDFDGIPDTFDNCPGNCNTQQLDSDNDSIGDVCDPEPGCGGCGADPCEIEC
jgi:subtilisin family serine protease